MSFSIFLSPDLSYFQYFINHSKELEIDVQTLSPCILNVNELTLLECVNRINSQNLFFSNQYYILRNFDKLKFSMKSKHLLNSLDFKKCVFGLIENHNHNYLTQLAYKCCRSFSENLIYNLANNYNSRAFDNYHVNTSFALASLLKQFDLKFENQDNYLELKKFMFVHFGYYDVFIWLSNLSLRTNLITEQEYRTFNNNRNYFNRLHLFEFNLLNKKISVATNMQVFLNYLKEYSFNEILNYLQTAFYRIFLYICFLKKFDKNENKLQQYYCKSAHVSSKQYLSIKYNFNKISSEHNKFLLKKLLAILNFLIQTNYELTTLHLNEAFLLNSFLTNLNICLLN